MLLEISNFQVYLDLVAKTFSSRLESTFEPIEKLREAINLLNFNLNSKNIEIIFGKYHSVRLRHIESLLFKNFRT